MSMSGCTTIWILCVSLNRACVRSRRFLVPRVSGSIRVLAGGKLALQLALHTSDVSLLKSEGRNLDPVRSHQQVAAFHTEAENSHFNQQRRNL